MRNAWQLLGLFIGVLLSLTARAEGTGVHPPAETLEALKVAAAHEFLAAAQSLRERLAYAEAHDSVGEAVADEALQEHRARFLDLKRAIERRSPAPSSAADLRSPFVPDFRAPAPAPAIARTVSPGGVWDLYARESTQNPASPPTEDGLSSPTRSPQWGMYGQWGSKAPVTAARLPVLAYRPAPSSPVAAEESDLRRVSTHTTEKRQ